MAVEKIDMNPEELDGQELDFGDEVEGVDPDVLEQAAGEAGGDDDGEGQGEGGQQQPQAASGSDAGQQGNKAAPQSIPYDRFAEVNSKRKAAEETAQAEREQRIRLEEQLKALQSQQAAAPAAPATPPPAPVDTKALIKERNVALLEGDDDKVVEIEAKLETERVRQAEERAFARLRKEQEEASARAQTTELQQVAAEMVAAYPFLNSQSPDADAEAIEDVIAIRDRGIAKGLTPAEALRKAVERFKPAFDARVGAQGDAGGQPDPTAASKMRNARAANQQPPSMSGGMSAGAVPQLQDVNKMTADDWAKLPDVEREKHLV